MPRSKKFNDAISKRTLALSVTVGVVAGLGALLFYTLLHLSTAIFLNYICNYYPPSAPGEISPIELHFNPANGVRRWLLILIPTLGGLVSGVIVYSFAPEAEGHGTDAVIEAVHNKGGKIRGRIPIIKTIASAITIGSGGSAGREGPIAQIGAGFASILSQKLKLSPKERELLVICGAGAGIGSIFKAPFGGALFSIEVLYKRDYEVEAFIPAIVSSFIGYGVFALATGWQPIFIALPYTFNPLELPFFAILGIISGLVSILYITVFYGLRDKFFRQMRIPDHFKPAIGGFLLGLMAYFFPAVLGPGYGWLQLSMAGKLALSLMVILIFAKILATSFTISSGGSGGVFAPSVFIGAMLGGAIGLIFHLLFPTVVSKPEIFALVGMGAFFSGAAKVPIAAIIIISEMTGDYNILIPAILASSMAYLVSGDYTIYEKQVLTRADSPIHIPELLSGILSSLKVKNVMTKDVITIKPTATTDELEKLINESGHLGFPVVNEKGELVGIVTYEDVIKIKPEERPKVRVENIETRKLIVAYPNETLDAVLRKIVLHDISRLPVVDPKDPKKLVGIITRYDIARAIHVK
ncbi:MAG: chloride channel protein [Candidatus Baldrarchaeia archaeon]